MTTHNTWDEGALASLNHIAAFAAELRRNDDVFDVCFEGLGAFVRSNEPDSNSFGIGVDLIERAGIAAMHILGADEPFDLAGMHRLLVSKQHDYGHKNILHFGMKGIAVRLCDKIARMNNLVSRGSDAKNEALTDTYMDILGYAAIALMLEDGSFELELKQDGRK